MHGISVFITPDRGPILKDFAEGRWPGSGWRSGAGGPLKINDARMGTCGTHCPCAYDGLGCQIKNGK